MFMTKAYILRLPALDYRLSNAGSLHHHHHLIQWIFVLVVHKNVVGGNSIIWGFPLVIANSEQDMPGIEPGPLGWATRSKAIS